MSDTPFEVRPMRDGDRLAVARAFVAVAEERDGIATEPPIDVEARAASLTLDGALVAVADGEIVGSLHVERALHKLSLSVLPAQRRRDRALPRVRLRRGGTAREALPALERRAVGCVEMGLLL